MRALLISPLFAALLLPGCATPQNELVARRAAFDLDCEEALEVTDLGGNVWGVRGCGQKASYVCVEEFEPRQTTCYPDSALPPAQEE